LKEVVCPVLKLREEKQTLVRVGGGKVDFFLLRLPSPNVSERKCSLREAPKIMLRQARREKRS
jgi:hypothetical protein